ncbi:ComF family protein [Pedobacter sp. HMF7647]|uniref:ComF family protein n=1 Tax=Hufsiella arboris TaxID=2695275 RepID=A0A7K1YAX1_9SPHI|nr:ComF family protein [Hufsiella arboris]MXV51735.1 ComF family protein [Hufsiella arboris]
MNLLYSYLQDFLSLIYPDLCAACYKNLFKNEQTICTDCFYHLPYTNFHKDESNRLAQQLWGRFPFEKAMALLYFHKGSKVQNLMHQLKYSNQPQVGLKLGEIYGTLLKNDDSYDVPDIIIPVPLHPAKLKKRGYNQSDYFAEGLSGKLGVFWDATGLHRTRSTESQTKKSRFMRYENMKETFHVPDKAKFENKHVLLVDDVITTGATLEGCAAAFFEIKGVKISIAGIAYAN